MLLSSDGPKPRVQAPGLASFPFARRYLGNRVCFLFLRVLRCFSSPRFLMSYYFTHMTMPEHYPRRVPPFGYLRIIGYVLLPAAFRSLSRPSSAPSAKASALCPSLLGLFLYPRFSRFIRFSLAAIHGAHVWAFFVKKLFLFFAFLASRCLASSLIPIRYFLSISFCDALFAFSIVRFSRYFADLLPACLHQPLRLMVENKGFEPLTPCVQSRCSPI